MSLFLLCRIEASVKPKKQGRNNPPLLLFYFRLPAEFLAAALCARAAKPPFGVCPPLARAVVLWILAAELVVIGADLDDLELFFMLSSLVVSKDRYDTTTAGQHPACWGHKPEIL